MARTNTVEYRIAMDKEEAIAAMAIARNKGLKIIELHPQSEVPAELLDLCLEEIKPQERIRVTLPRAFTHFGGSDKCDWDTVDEIQNQFTGPAVPDDVFVTLRHNGDDGDNVIVDIYHI